LKNCAESQNAYDIYFDKELSEEFINKFSVYGKIVFSNINNFKYFRIIVKGQFTIKGFVGNNDFRVLIADNLGENFIDKIIEKISSF
jgi:hypothetical protein